MTTERKEITQELYVAGLPNLALDVGTLYDRIEVLEEEIRRLKWKLWNLPAQPPLFGDDNENA